MSTKSQTLEGDGLVEDREEFLDDLAQLVDRGLVDLYAGDDDADLRFFVTSRGRRALGDQPEDER